MDIKIFEVGPFAENTYLLIKGDKAILIDPGFAQEPEFQTFKSVLSKSGIELEAIVLTHAHVDHVMGVQRVLKDFDIPVYLNHEDLFLWENFGNQATMFGLNQVGFSFTPEELPKEGIFTVGAFSFECLYTPGHAPDHTALYFKDEQLVIAGDALFKQSIGRTDLYKGDFELLAQSIRTKLYTLPDNTVVYPGHGESTTIGFEKKHNSFVKG
jgi:glyoxylase-like metal-dependent hydrolase (beta-lactamase superfamily II)